jgi:hypothetical protein
MLARSQVNDVVAKIFLYENSYLSLATGESSEKEIGSLAADNNVDGGPDEVDIFWNIQYNGPTQNRTSGFSISVEPKDLDNPTFDSFAPVVGLLSTPSQPMVTSTSTLNNIRIYPNPFKPYDGDPDTGIPYDGSANSGIIFDNLTENCTIKIFNLAGELVDELSGITGKAQWDAKNKKGKEVASGVYIYLITDKDGRKATGKFAIVR